MKTEKRRFSQPDLEPKVLKSFSLRAIGHDVARFKIRGKQVRKSLRTPDIETREEQAHRA